MIASSFIIESNSGSLNSIPFARRNAALFGSFACRGNGRTSGPSSRAFGKHLSFINQDPVSCSNDLNNFQIDSVQSTARRRWIAIFLSIDANAERMKFFPQLPEERLNNVLQLCGVI